MPATFQLDPSRIKHYRQSANLTMNQVAIDLRGNHGRGAITTYQRIERTGRTTKQRAETLATILGVPLEDLLPASAYEHGRGFGPLLRTVQNALQAMMDDPEQSLLNRLREEASRNEGVIDFGWIADSLARNGVRETAVRVGRGLERVSLLGGNEAFADIASRIGVPEEARTQFIYIDGLWLVQMDAVAPAPILGGNDFSAMPVASILHGVVDAVGYIAAALNATGQPAVRAGLSADGNRYRLAIEPPLASEIWRAEILRCGPAPDGGGLRYDALSELDQYFLCHFLEERVADYAWELEGFSRPDPATESLAFSVFSQTMKDGAVTRSATELVNGRGTRDDFDDTAPFSRGFRHWYVTCNLVPALLRHLSPMLEPIAGELQEPSLDLVGWGLAFDRFAPGAMPTRYFIKLVSQGADGQLAETHWPKAARMALRDQLATLIAQHR